ncbi:nucleotidyltransferase domain-containing protein [Candidatus Pacearchaeota archaeon]|nr:nucleotidyltransferase domain-containing protein [Candidatus Pacearchaeota archaeon]
MKLLEQYSVDSVFLDKPWKKITYKDIEKLSGKKSRSYIYRSLERLQKESIIKKEEVGKSLLYSLNLTSLNTKLYMGFLEEYKSMSSKHVPLSLVSNLSNLAFKVTPFFILLITGSYARNKQTSKSDLDVVIICDDKVDPKSILAELKLESELSIPPVHLFVFRKKKVLDMLSSDKENYGKEFVRNHLLFRGGSSYFDILWEAINHGFNG